MHVCAKIRQRALLLVLVAYLTFTSIPSVRRKLLNVDTRAVSSPEVATRLELSEVVSAQPTSAGNMTTSTTFTQTPDSTLNYLDVWRLKRQSLLSKKAAKVVLFAYMRGGSSLGGQLFNVHPKASLWYEPGDAFYSTYFGIEGNLPQNDIYNHDMTRRSPGSKEKRWFTEYYTNIFECRYDRLPPQLLVHPYIRQSLALKNFTNCLSQHGSPSGSSNCVNRIKGFCGTRFVEASWKANCHGVIQTARDVIGTRPNGTVLELTELIRKELVSRRIEPNPDIDAGLENFTLHELCIQNLYRIVERCLPKAVEKCPKDSIRAVKMLRHRMEDLDPLIGANPDLFVVHYVRDPRAIAASRTNTNYLMWDKMDKRPSREAEVLCSRIREDLKRRADLEMRYPGAFLQIRYEDLVRRPLEVAFQVYSFIGKDVPGSWQDFVRAVMIKSPANGTGVPDHLYAWKRRIPLDQQEAINSFCGDVLKDLSYPQ